MIPKTTITPGERGRKPRASGDDPAQTILASVDYA